MQSSTRQKTPPITFVHSADWQLGKPFAGVVDPAKRARVQQERFEAIRRIGAVVRECRAQCMVVAGDLFDSPTPTHATISAALGAIAEIGVPVLAIPGNHDHAGPDSLWEKPFFQRERSRLAPNFHLLTTRTPHIVALPDRGEGEASVALLPCPLLRRHEPDDPTAWLRSYDFSEIGDIPRIVIAHGSTISFSAAGGFAHDDDDDGSARAANTIALDRLPLDEIDYIALGDFHGFSAVGSRAWYAGTPEIDRFPKTGQEPGHVACATVGRGTPPTVAAIRTGRFRWLALTIALDAADANAGDQREPAGHGPASVDDSLMQATQPRAEGEPGFDGCLADVSITGTVSLGGRAELDRIIESWEARLVRLDLDDSVRIAPTLDEIHDLAARPDDPIISRVAAELVQRLEAGGPAEELDVIRQAIFMLHALAHPQAASASPPASIPSSATSP
jgi:hypothetical protein